MEKTKESVSKIRDFKRSPYGGRRNETFNGSFMRESDMYYLPIDIDEQDQIGCVASNEDEYRPDLNDYDTTVNIGSQNDGDHWNSVNANVLSDYDHFGVT